MRVSDYIAKFLVEQNVGLVFTITGAGNVRLIESASNAGIAYVCPHYEQAAVMAALTRLRISGHPAVCLVTGGPGAANTLIAVADAHLDSIPCIIIAGQEKLEFMENIIALCHAKNIGVGTFTDTLEGIEFWSKKGLAFLEYASDLNLFINAAKYVIAASKNSNETI